MLRNTVGVFETKFSAREAGNSIKPGAQAPGSLRVFFVAHEMGDSVDALHCRPLRGLNFYFIAIVGLAPQAFAYACFAG